MGNVIPLSNRIRKRFNPRLKENQPWNFGIWPSEYIHSFSDGHRMLVVIPKQSGTVVSRHPQGGICLDTRRGESLLTCDDLDYIFDETLKVPDVCQPSQTEINVLVNAYKQAFIDEEYLPPPDAHDLYLVLSNLKPSTIIDQRDLAEHDLDSIVSNLGLCACRLPEDDQSLFVSKIPAIHDLTIQITQAYQPYWESFSRLKDPDTDLPEADFRPIDYGICRGILLGFPIAEVLAKAYVSMIPSGEDPIRMPVQTNTPLNGFAVYGEALKPILWGREVSLKVARHMGGLYTRSFNALLAHFQKSFRE